MHLFAVNLVQTPQNCKTIDREWHRCRCYVKGRLKSVYESSKRQNKNVKIHV